MFSGRGWVLERKRVGTALGDRQELGRGRHVGRSLGYTEAEVRDDDGRLIAKASSTCKRLRQE